MNQVNLSDSNLDFLKLIQINKELETLDDSLTYLNKFYNTQLKTIKKYRLARKTYKNQKEVSKNEE